MSDSEQLAKILEVLQKPPLPPEVGPETNITIKIGVLVAAIGCLFWIGWNGANLYNRLGVIEEWRAGMAPTRWTYKMQKDYAKQIDQGNRDKKLWVPDVVQIHDDNQ